MKAPSAMRALLRAAKGCSSSGARLPRCCATASDPEVAPSTRFDTTTPSGRSPISDTSGAKIPSTKTNNRASDTRQGVTSMRGATADGDSKTSPSMALSPVNRHSSWRRVGRPRVAKLSRPRARRSWSNSGAGKEATASRALEKAPALVEACVMRRPPGRARPRATRSPGPRAGGQAPGRRSARCVRRSGRGRSPARCS